MQAEEAQAHGSVCFSSYHSSPQTGALCGLEAHVAARVDLGKRPAQALDVALESSSGDPRVQATQSVISRGSRLQAGTIPDTAGSSLHGRAPPRSAGTSATIHERN